MFLPKSVKYIINILQDHGFEAYAVGGCVRDSIIDRPPDDWDITTSALPEQTKELFQKTFDTGIEHGTITVLVDGVGYEVTTYRIDGEYQDSRRPDHVEFTASLKEDLRRRDFTINAMAYNEKDGLVDIFGGMEDLEAETIRCVGCATERFREDALRILRAVRFAAQLEFNIEENTAKAIVELAPTLNKISAERIQVEMLKLLISSNPEYILKAYDLGITEVILPEFNIMMETEQESPHHCFSVGVHTVNALKLVRNEKISRLTILLHDVGKPKTKLLDKDMVAHFKGHELESEKIAKSIMKRWKLDNKTMDAVSKLIRYHDYRPEPTIQNIRRGINKIGMELYPIYLEIRYADIMSQSEYLRAEKIKNLEETKSFYHVIVAENHCVSLKDLAISGGDLMALGIPQGKEIGNTLQKLLDLVLEDHTLNDKKVLLEKVNMITRD